MPETSLYYQTKLRERLKSISDSRLLSLETIVTSRLADVKRFINWPALEQSYARDLKAIHDEMRVRERNKQQSQAA